MLRRRFLMNPPMLGPLGFFFFHVLKKFCLFKNFFSLFSFSYFLNEPSVIIIFGFPPYLLRISKAQEKDGMSSLSSKELPKMTPFPSLLTAITNKRLKLKQFVLVLFCCFVFLFMRFKKQIYLKVVSARRKSPKS